MKRCPRCNRIEPDDILTFCRADGAVLVANSSALAPEIETAQLGSASIGAEVKTSILPHTTDSNTGTGPTTVLASASVANRTKPNLRKATIIAVAALALLTVCIAVVIGFHLASTSHSAIRTIAVMPFANESGNADVEYVSDGMTETLINTLSQLPDLTVKARSSVFRYKGREVEPQTVGNELNVQAILNGRVVQRGNDLTLYLALVDTRTGNQVWGEQYSRKQDDLLSLQNEVGRNVALKLKSKLSGSEEAKVAKNYTQNADAYQLYLQGRYFWNKRTTQNLQKSIEYFQKAIEKDPNYALGYAGLSDGYALLAYYGGAPAQEALPKAREAALKALSLDDNLAEAHNALGFVLVLYDYDYAGAQREYARALELNPNYALARQNLGVMLTRIGRATEGMVEVRRGLEIEPVSVVLNRLYGDMLVCTRRYDEGLVQLNKTFELDPGFPTIQLSFSSVYQLTGKFAESAEAYAKYHELSDRLPTAKFIRDSFARGGWQGYLKEMTGSRRPDGLTPYMAANYFAQLGDRDRAFAELDKALENHEWLLLYVRIDPRMDPLRDDPRFKDLLRRMRFPNG